MILQTGMRDRPDVGSRRPAAGMVRARGCGWSSKTREHDNDS